MNAVADRAEEREVRLLARRYARDGYRVTRPGPSGNTLPFLEGFVPDLIAEREGDRVIVEVKRADAVKGGNELKAVAERVARVPGWRFELVTVAPEQDEASRRTHVLHALARQARGYLQRDLPGPAYITALHALEEALELRALPQDRRAREKSAPRLAHDLVVAGVIPRELFEQARSALRRGEQVLVAAEQASAEDVDDLLRLAADLLQQELPEAAE